MQHTSIVAGYDIGGSLQNATDQFFGYLPNILGFLVILLIGYIIAKIVQKVAVTLLHKLKVDEHLRSSQAGGVIEKVSPGGSAAAFVGKVVFWLIFLFALTAAIGALKIPAVTSFMNDVLSYLPNVIAAVLIFVVAAAISGGVAAAVKRAMGDTPTGKLAETVIPGIIMAIALFMILTQLRIAPNIVIITYAALLGMLSLAGALAFGLGGREVAADMWRKAYESGQRNKDQVKSDLQQGTDNARSQASSATGSTSSGGSTRVSPTTARRPAGPPTA